MNPDTVHLLIAAGSAIVGAGLLQAFKSILVAYGKRIEQRTKDDADRTKAAVDAVKSDADVTAKHKLAETDALAATAKLEAALADHVVAQRADIQEIRGELRDCENGRAVDRAACKQETDDLRGKVAVLTERVNSVTPPAMKAVTP